ncbi:MAG: N-acetylmuramoyl-L-alanine amidase [Ruminococcaceae bacterium]|nr:N-acetylmuramoyl-L-alanine amidase [Oscillospiraceae bacterium]
MRKKQKILPAIAVALLFLHITGIINTDGLKHRAISAVAEIGTESVLIIDAGHGGADGGAVATDGTLESSINLDIALKLDNLAHIFGVNSLLTRSSEILAYPEDKTTISDMKRWDQKTRLKLINSVSNAVLISIHQNKFPDGKPFGPQVLYGNDGESEYFGTLCHDYLNTYLCPQNRRVATPAPKDIFLIKNAACTAILVECGFLSNANDLIMLCKADYQTKIAAVLLSAYLNYI